MAAAAGGGCGGVCVGQQVLIYRKIHQLTLADESSEGVY